MQNPNIFTFREPEKPHAQNVGNISRRHVPRHVPIRIEGDTAAPSRLYARLCHAFLVFKDMFVDRLTCRHAFTHISHGRLLLLLSAKADIQVASNQSRYPTDERTVRWLVNKMSVFTSNNYCDYSVIDRMPIRGADNALEHLETWRVEPCEPWRLQRLLLLLLLLPPAL